MESAQVLAQQLHDVGYSDSEIAQAVNVTREYINKIRSGRKNASASLAESLHSVYTRVCTDTASEVSSDIGSLNGTETGGSIWPLIIVAGLLVVFIGGVCYAAYRTRKIKEDTEENTDTGIEEK